MNFSILMINLFVFSTFSSVVQSIPQSSNTENTNCTDLNETSSKSLNLIFALKICINSDILIDSQELLLKAASEGNMQKNGF